MAKPSPKTEAHGAPGPAGRGLLTREGTFRVRRQPERVSRPSCQEIFPPQPASEKKSFVMEASL